jgi:hypothetical protein
MKVINETDYDTKELKELFTRCCQEKLSDHNKLLVKVRYTTSRFILGWAWTKIEIALPKKYLDIDFIKKRWRDTYENHLIFLNFNRVLAFVFIHETFHILHQHHSDMRGSYYSGWNKFLANSSRLSFADSFNILKKGD